MAITRDTVLAALASPLGPRPIYKASVTGQTAGIPCSLWKAAGMPIAGANPPLFSAGSGYTPDRTTAGALGQPNPTTTATYNKYLAQQVMYAAAAGTLVLYDRVWACSGFDTTVTTAQAVTTPGNLPTGRDPNTGADVEPWFEIYTATGATAATVTLTGVDAAGNTGRTWTYAKAASALAAGQMSQFTPGTAATGGIRQVTSVTFSASTGTAGSFGITLLRRISMYPVALANIAGQSMDAFATGLPEILDDACVAMLVIPTTTASGVWQGTYFMVDLAP